MVDQKKRKQTKSFDNQFLSGPDYDRQRPGKQQKTVKQDQPLLHKPIISGVPRSYTVSVAIPSSIIDACPTLDLKTILAGQIARALAIHNVDEIVIYEDRPSNKTKQPINPNLFLARIFQHMETPQYMRKTLVPFHEDLKAAGLLPRLEVPHHPSMEDMTLYREGVTLGQYFKEGGTLVDIGCLRRAKVNQQLQPGVRVTLELATPVAAKDTKKGQIPISATIVSPKVPREKAGLYWGYNIRLSSSFSRVITESPYKDGYDYTIGVSDHSGKDIYESASKSKSFKHLLIAFGAPGHGLEEAIEADEDLKVGSDDASEIFDVFVTPGQNIGTRNLRLEESLPMVLSVFKPMILKNGS
ncbi:putative RNA methyltransferase [Halteromyces radiatus]|uniref:putative RNA methyltransferase n=1 Tax=Halteromyces radiatus TaxID=101107 RepID=UPI00221EB52A|nr:putative RNA methyltransferase [Halteromyces radiatus]KAI8099629.1 putative RNA methyltransferase [Halteromyces radiatus]